MTKVYETNQIIEELCRRDFFETIFAKVKISEKEFDCYVKIEGLNHGFILPTVYTHDPKELLPHIHVGEEYIISIYNMYHQQLMNMKILQFHHNVTRDENLYRYINKGKEFWLKKDFEDDRFA